MLVDHEYIPGWDDKGMGSYTVEIDDPNSPGKTKTVTITSDDFDWGMEEAKYTELLIEVGDYVTNKTNILTKMEGEFDLRTNRVVGTFEKYFKGEADDGTLEESLASLAFDNISVDDPESTQLAYPMFSDEDRDKFQGLVKLAEESGDWKAAKDFAVKLAVDRITNMQNDAYQANQDLINKISGDKGTKLKPSQILANKQWEGALKLGKAKKKIKSRAVSTNMYGRWEESLGKWTIVNKDDEWVPVYMTGGEPEQYTLEEVLRELGYTDTHLPQ